MDAVSDMERLCLALIRSVAHHSRQYHHDNVDIPRSLLARGVIAAKQALFGALSRAGYGLTRVGPKEAAPDLSWVEGQLVDLARVHAGLADDASRELLVELLAYHMLGRRHVMLPLRRGYQYRRLLDALDRLVDSPETIQVRFQDLVLRHFDLRPIGFDLRLFGLPAGVVNTFSLRQYEYQAQGHRIAAPAG